mmetsp:Transcript_19653/g.23371  ORF Transcript_19653/g.23371 Transcript_19653/m.23371 type:complete len:271 (+) Transcript_19653:44-856(+)
MEGRGGKLPSRKYNHSRSRSPRINSPAKTPPAVVSPLTYFPTELERLRSQLDEQQKDLDTVSACSDTESLYSLMEALESVHPARLSAKQRLYRDAHMKYRTKMFTPFTNFDDMHQREADQKRSQPLRPTQKVLYRGALPPKLYPNYANQYNYEQRAIGVKVGPVRGDGGGQLETFFNCPRDLSEHDKQEAWKVSMRGMSNIPQTSTRMSNQSCSRGTVMGATPNPDKLTQPAQRHVDNSYNRYDRCNDSDSQVRVPQPAPSFEANVWYEG